jgi:ribosome-associated protein
MVNQKNDGSNDDELDFESRTQKKHYAHSMVDLAHKLAEIKHSHLIELPITESIIDAITESKKIKSHIARKRHFQFIGKLLLKADHQAVIDALQSQERQHEAGLIRQPFLQMWQEKVLEDNDIIAKLYETHDHSDIQTLRQLVRAASKDNANTKKNKRKVFEHLRMMDNQEPLPTSQTAI